MPYEIVTGSTGNNTLLFKGILGTYGGTLVNPYSGYTITLSPTTKNINNAIYDGLAGNDTISMTELGDVLTLVDAEGTIMVKNVEIFNAGLDGDIIILAHDTLTYGNVNIFGSDGDDILWSNVGNDLIRAGSGDDNVDGGGGNDTLYGGVGNDYIAGGLGRDLLAGGEGDDTLVYSVDGKWSNTYTLASLGSALSFAASINLAGMNRSFDTFSGDATDNLAVPTAGTDTLLMTSGDDVLSISDTISPLSTLLAPRVAYMEIIDAGAGNDIVDLSGDAHVAVTIYGGDGNDILAGSIGNDIIYGDAGNDRLIGGEGADTLYGGAGDDTYYFDVGNDRIIEGSGNDTLHINAGSLDELVLSVDGTDLKIEYGGDVITIQNHFAADGSGKVETLRFSNNATFNLGTWYPNVDPQAQDDTFSGQEGEIISGNVLLNDTDTPGEILNVVADIFRTDNNGLVTLNSDGTFTYEGAEGFSGVDNFVYTVQDNNGGSSTATVSINVISVNTAPVAVDDSFSDARFQIITGNVLEGNPSGVDYDVDDDILSVQAQTITTVQGAAVVIESDGSFTYTPAPGFYGIDNFTYTLLDGQGGSDIGNVRLDIAFVNNVPDAQDDVFSGNANTPITGNVLSNDSTEPGETLMAVAETVITRNHASVTINTDGTFTYIGALNFVGEDSFAYTALDGVGGSNAATVFINVAPANNGPVANNDVYSAREDNAITGNLLTNDTVDPGSALTAVAGRFTTTQGGTIRIEADGSFFYRGALNFNGTDSYVYTAKDSLGNTTTATVTMNISAVNDAPIAMDDAFSGFRNGQITGNLFADNGAGVDSDVDGDTLTVQAQTITTALGGTVVMEANGSFAYTPASGFTGEDSFDYTLLDGNGGSDTGTVSLTVALPGSAIVGTGDSETIKATDGDEQIYGMGGNDILYGDDGFVPLPVAADKKFADTQIVPDFVNRTNIADLKPSGVAAMGIAAGNLSIDREAEATITFRKGGAGKNSSLGTYFIADDGTIKSASLLWNNVKTAGVDVEHNIELPVGPNGGNYGFFIIANGDNNNAGYAGLNTGVEGNIQFIYNYGKAGQREARITDDGKRISIVYDDGIKTQVLKGPAYFTTERGESALINRDGKVHVASGLVDKNNLKLDIEAGDIGVNQTTFTKNGITLTAFGGALVLAPGERIGIQGPKWGQVVNPTETLRVSFAASEKVILTLKGLDHGGAVDFKIYINGDMNNPILVEHASGVRRTESIEFYLSDFGGLITAIDVTPTKSASYPADTFWLHDVEAYIPGGGDTDVLRIGFEDLTNLGDADFEDVLFDLNISPDLATEGESLLGGNDFLDGGEGNDILYGEGGNDILVLGLGRDQAYGGAGADTFAITLVDSLLDRIHDFNAAEGDVINVSDVLEGYDPLTDDIANFIKFVQIGDDTHIRINADGVGNDFVGAVYVYGGTDADLATMIENGSLVAHQSALS